MTILRFALRALSSFALVLPVCAQDTGYRLPPPEVVQILDAPPTPSVRASPDARWLLLVEQASMPPIADVARPWVGLAGVRIDPKYGVPWRASYSIGLRLRSVADASERRIEIVDPSPARIIEVSWSHDSKHFAFTRAGEKAVELWAGDAASGDAKLIAGAVSGALGSSFGWMPDGSSLWYLEVPRDRGEAPKEPTVPSGPSVQVAAGEKSPLRTFTDLLRNEFDASLFEHYASAQLAVIGADGSGRKTIGASGIWGSIDPSPDGQHWLVTRVHRPFSYVMTWSDFPQAIEVWDAGGKLERTIVDVPLAENIPIEGVRTGPRSVQWEALAPASLAWCEALDGGDPKKKAEWRDRWVELAAPFSGDAKEFLRLHHRSRGLTSMNTAGRWLASEYDRDRRWTRTLYFDLAKKDAEPKAIDDRSVNDRYADPGRPVTTETPRGTRVVRQDGDWIYRSGNGESSGGARPFLDRMNLATGATERLWRCSPGSYESVGVIASSDAEKKPVVLNVYQSPDEAPNWRVRDLNDNSIRALTNFPDPTPQLRGIKKQLVSYARADGVELSATLYLPSGYQQGTRLPLVVWAYPQEFNDPSTAGQVSGSPFSFTRITGPSHLFFLTQGYAVMDNATMPIVGDPETMNDTFIDQIVSSAKAAIDKAVELGIADGKHVGVGGHSYGAFMTANLLAHCDLFQAGIARSGAYNRTLTPFGFQSERRTLWEAPDIYAKLSPFMYADKIKTPLLLIHGEKDSNSGTFPIQSERLFQAIKGHGGTARYVTLPGESHGYTARESVLHTLAEMIDWFDRYVKATPAGGGAPRPAEAGAERGQ
jgi:dipeptidyl aminopeptidase/acylaminoacyl peptidase